MRTVVHLRHFRIVLRFWRSLTDAPRCEAKYTLHTYVYSTCTRLLCVCLLIDLVGRITIWVIFATTFKKLRLLLAFFFPSLFLSLVRPFRPPVGSWRTRGDLFLSTQVLVLL